MLNAFECNRGMLRLTANQYQLLIGTINIQVRGSHVNKIIHGLS